MVPVEETFPLTKEHIKAQGLRSATIYDSIDAMIYRELQRLSTAESALSAALQYNKGMDASVVPLLDIERFTPARVTWS